MNTLLLAQDILAIGSISLRGCNITLQGKCQLQLKKLFMNDRDAVYTGFEVISRVEGKCLSPLRDYISEKLRRYG